MSRAINTIDKAIRDQMAITEDENEKKLFARLLALIKEFKGAGDLRDKRRMTQQEARLFADFMQHYYNDFRHLRPMANALHINPRELLESLKDGQNLFPVLESLVSMEYEPAQLDDVLKILEVFGFKLSGGVNNGTIPTER